MRGPTRLGITTQSAQAGTIDLGNEPPLTIGDDNEIEQGPVHRAVSWRWLTGTVLAGFTSILLMGGALTVALSSPNQFASLPDSLSDNPRGSDQITFGQKGDRIRPLDEEVSSRQVLQVSTVTRQGERDFIKLRPFAKINATLATRQDEFSDQIPAYDALRIFADNSRPEPETAPPEPQVGAGDDELYGANVDGEVAIKVSAFPMGERGMEPAGAFQDNEVEQIVRTAANFGSGDGDFAALSFADPTYGADDAEDDPFAASGVRIIPENVSNVARSDDGAFGESLDERIIAVSDKDDLGKTLIGHDVTEEDASEIVAALSGLVDVGNLHSGQKIRVAFATDEIDNVGITRPVRVSIYDDGAHQATVARADNDAFVRADAPAAIPAAFAEVEPETNTGGGLPRVYDAVYETALEQQVPTPLIDQLIRIFAFDVDLQSRITPGDSLEVFHSLPDPSDRDATDPEVLFASLTLGGTTKRFYRFRTSDDGVVDYYDEEGKSAKKFLMRKPVTTGVVRSGFGMRKHPILGYRRMHTGTDFAAPRGTPILAAGNGVVEKAGRNKGYGNFTLIKHTNGYQTGYAHQQKFAPGISPGARVRQGQVIGYVGSTGLSTGPHLHFEIRINGKPVDPLRVRLPRGRVLQGEYLASFQAERQRIDTLLGLEQGSTKLAAAN